MTTPSTSLLRLALLVALVVPTTLLAQSGSIHGTVTSTEQRSTVEGATVTVVGTRIGAVTASNGQYRLERVPAGVQDIEVRRVGFATRRYSVMVRANDATELAIVMAPSPTELVGVEVIGDASDALSKLPGSAAVIGQRQLRAQQPISANEVLRTVPGVYVVEEEGAGMRANIGIRGLDPDRSRTVLVLEDGAPVALAPYGEPELYYSPPVDRMERIEIIKGSGSVLFGPQTVGGVINYVTADAPVRPAGRVTIQGGSGSSRLIKARYGGTWGAARGIVNAFQRRAEDWNGLHFDMRDVTAKIGARTGAGDFGLKVSAYDERSNSTYVGLTDSIYRASPYTHPAPDDELALSRLAATLSHEMKRGTRTVRTTVYAYQTTRDWRRQDYSYTANGNAHVFRNSAGNRNRSFDVIGVEPRVRAAWSLGGLPNEIEAGVRGHYERARDQFIVGNEATASDGVLRDDEKRNGRAFAAFVQNRIFLSPSLYLTPGVRYEYFDFDRNILRTRIRRATGTGTTRNVEEVNITGGDEVSEIIPGIGAAWTPSPLLTVFAGAHRGFAPPRTKDALVYGDPTLQAGDDVPDPVSLQLDAERSWNLELGTRLTPKHYLSLEATLFLLDFSNQIIVPSLSGGAQSPLANQGETRHTGLEVGLGFDVGKLMRRPYSLALDVAYTFADAVFTDHRVLNDPAGTPVDVHGNRLPYAPRQRATAAVTFDHPRGILLRLDGMHVGEQFSDNFETRGTSPNGRIGVIPSHTVLDVSARFAIPRARGLAIIGSVKNLTDETFIASRRPEGIKVGLPRTTSAGLVLDF